jgi:hypothetical protein
MIKRNSMLKRRTTIRLDQNIDFDEFSEEIDLMRIADTVEKVI